MATETKSAPPATNEKDDAPPAADNGATKEAPPVADAPEKADDAKPEPPPPKPNVHKANFEKDVVYLYQFSRTPRLPSLSPCCLKIESWLRLAGIKYENVDHKMKYRSRRGQLPFIELNGEEIEHSAIIIKELSQKFGKDLDSGLSPQNRMVSHAMISMIENHLSWAILYFRAKNPDQLLIKGYKLNLKNAIGSRMPNSILNLLFKFSFGRKSTKKVKAQGMGLHTEEEIVEFGTQDLQALSDLLGDKPFFFGDEPTTLDVVAFANLAQLQFLENDIAHPLRDRLEASANLVALVNRIKERVFTDWDEICSKLDLNAHLPKPAKEEKKEEKPAEEPEKEKQAEEKEKEVEKESEEKNEKEK